MSNPVFTAADVETLRERAMTIFERYLATNEQPDEDDADSWLHQEAVIFLSFFQAYCELTGRQNPQ